MAESAIFLIVAAFIIAGAIVIFNIHNIDPRLLMIAAALFLVPGFYGALTSGPFVPSSRKRHRTLLTLADIQSTDVVYDLGCGDGRLVFEAAKRARKTVGYELSIPLFIFGRAKQFLLRSKGQIRYGNIWTQDYRDADVILCYLLPRAMRRFPAEIWPQLKPGTRVISNAFQIPGITPIKSEDGVHLYRVDPSPNNLSTISASFGLQRFQD